MASQPDPTINLQEFMRGRESGAVKIVKINGVAHYSKKGFDPESGAPMPVLLPISKEDIERSVAGMESDLAAMKQLIADLDAAKEVIG
jgi:hypothetical protein